MTSPYLSLQALLAKASVADDDKFLVFDGDNASLTASVLKQYINAAMVSLTQLNTALEGYLPSNGNAVSATKLQTARNVALSGPVTGATTFDGTGDASIETAIADGALTQAMVNGLVAALADKLSGTFSASTTDKTGVGLHWTPDGNVANFIYRNSDGTTDAVSLTSSAAVAALINAATSSLISGTTSLGPTDFQGIGLHYDVPNDHPVFVYNNASGATQYRGLATVGTSSDYLYFWTSDTVINLRIGKILIQAFEENYSSGSSSTITFPTAFSAAPYVAMSCMDSVNTKLVIGSLNALSTTSVTFNFAVGQADSNGAYSSFGGTYGKAWIIAVGLA